MESVQPLIVGGDSQLSDEVIGLLGKRAMDSLHLGVTDLEATDWQRRRQAQKVVALIAVARDEPSDDETIMNWTQLVRVSFRPARLVVLVPEVSLDMALRVARAGADGILPRNASAADIVAEWEREGTSVGSYFPDPHTWLHSLQRACEELFLVEDERVQLLRLMRIFTGQLKVDRAMVALRDGDQLVVNAGVGLPPDLMAGTPLNPTANTLVNWVIENRRARLVEAGMHGAPTLLPDVRWEISIPLVFEDEVLGAASFSSLEGGRTLSTADLAAAEVFGGLLAISIINSRLNRENVEAERLATIGRTTAGISHCLKNMLMVLRGSATMMRMGIDGDDPDRVRDGLDMIDRAARRIESVVFDLLDFSKSRPVAPRPTAPTSVLANLNEAIGVLCRNHGIDLTSETTMSPDEHLLLDENRLHRALMNLAGNAMDAVQRNGRIHVAARHEEQHIVFSVEDNGPGVPEAERSKIFNAFFSTKGSKGTGLGLAMVAKFCEEHGGVAVAREGDRLGGLCVELRLPYQKAAEFADSDR